MAADPPPADEKSPDKDREIARLKQALEQANDDLLEAEKTIQRLAGTDSLTGALNRTGLERILLLEQRRKGETELTVILINLNGFSKVNERLGFTAGDVVLQEASRRIRMVIRDDDHLARIGGDEFLVLLPQTTEQKGRMVARRIRAAIADTAIELTGEEVHIGASIGLTSIPETVISHDEILASATEALNSVRKLDRPEQEAEQEDQAEVDTVALEVLSGLKQGEGIRIFAQQIYDLPSGAIVGFELLARGPVNTVYESPIEFFRLATDHHALAPVDRACFQKCIEGALAGPDALRYHINLFPSTLVGLQPEFVLDMIPVERRDKVCIELNEQQIIGRPHYLLEVVQELQEGGVSFAIDDVGFGRSCLENLVVLEPDFVKVDRRLVFGVSESERAAFEFRRLLNVIQTLGATVVAEGVETEADLEALKEMQVPMAQGWIWGKPFPAEEMKDRATSENR